MERVSADDHSITLSLEGPQPQHRATVAFRVILAIPHFIYAAVIGVVYALATIGAWFSALFLGRVPFALAEFLARALQYLTRVYAYGQLMTDRYPSFTLGPSGYPVELEIDEPGRHSRAAVLFRIILMIPAAFVSSIAMGGLSVALVVVWLIVLISGRMPYSLYEAIASVFRYQQRLWAYASLLTSEYPRGLFGDEPRTHGSEAVDSEFVTPTTRPRITRLVLSRAGRRLVVLFLVLGVLFQVATTAIQIAIAATQDDLDELEGLYEDATFAFGDYFTEIQLCARSGDPSCSLPAIRELRQDVLQVQRDLEAMELPAAALDDADAVRNDLAAIADALSGMERAETDVAFQQQLALLGEAATDFDLDFVDLYDTVARS